MSDVFGMNRSMALLSFSTVRRHWMGFEHQYLQLAFSTVIFFFNHHRQWNYPDLNGSFERSIRVRRAKVTLGGWGETNQRRYF
jgi:hypothetical protein